MPRRSRLALALLLAGALAACSGDPSATRQRSPSPRPGGQTVAAVRRTGAVDLLWVGADRRAEQVATLSPPRPADRPLSVSLAAGDSPEACVLWGDDDADTDEARSLLCYAGGTSMSRAVRGLTGQVATVALRPDGQALAWVEQHGEPTYQSDVLVADLRDGVVAGTRRFAFDPGCPRDDTSRCVGFQSPHLLAWSGLGALVLSIGSESDDGSDLRLLSLDAAGAARGWLKASTVVRPPKADAGYRYFDEVAAATAGSAYAVERDGGWFEDDYRKPARAVRVELPTGRVLEVVATPARGRKVVAVSGGARGVVYLTAATGDAPDLRVYLRLPGEKQGTQVTGLPADVQTVVAQPGP